MTNNLKAYILNKVLSISLPVITILGSLWFLGYTELQWQFILLVLIACGYTHFIIGFIYQWKAFFRKPGLIKQITTFLFLTMVAIFLVQVIVLVSGYAVGLFIGFIYFLLHGLFNEQTLLKREGGVDMSLLSISSVMVLLLSLLTYSVPDPTALFDRSLNFLAVDSFTFNIVFSSGFLSLSLFTYLFWGGVLISFILLLCTWLKEKNTKLSLFFFTLYVSILLAVLVGGSLPYIYVYFIVVGYHLVTWFIFYLRVFKRKSSIEFRDFLLLHLLVIAPFVFASWLFFKGDQSVFVITIIDYKYYVYATFIHITTSFMNDDWFVVVQDKVFNFLKQKSSQ